jgi:outer membrane protein TolC
MPSSTLRETKPPAGEEERPGKEAVMPRVRFRSRWLAGGLAVAGCSLLSTGCAETAAERAEIVPPPVRLVRLPPGSTATIGIVPLNPSEEVTPVAYRPAQPEKITHLPAPQADKPPAELAPPRLLPAEEKPVPINLDSVLRLAEEQNAQIAVAREKLHESEAEQALAAKAWLPQVYAGTGYYRHEGGIQNEDGTLQHSSSGALFAGIDLHAEIDLREATYQRVKAERQMWQQRGELSKVTSETLLEAATAYLDLLTARRGEAVAKELEKYLLDVQERAEKMVMPEDRSAQVLVEAARAEVSGRRQAIAKLHQQGDAAAAKLAYLLGLPPCAKMVPVEETLVPIDLVDPTPPLCDLVARAQENGPGVRELQSMLTAMQEGLDRASGPVRFLPTVEVNTREGLFYAGPGGELSPDNQWDTCVRVKWNLTEFATARERRRIAETKIEQARMTYEDLRGKLTAGVEEARSASLSGREQIAHSAEQIRHAAKSYELSDQRWKMRVPNATAAEVLVAIRGLEAAHYNYLTTINAYNKAQIRLLVLLGPTAAHGDKPHFVLPHGGVMLKPEL